MAWPTITLEDVQALAHDARIEAAWDANDETELSNRFAALRDAEVARVRVMVGRHNALESAAGTVPPEFRTLVALRILKAVLARPGAVGEEGRTSFELTRDQRELLDSAEKLLTEVFEGRAPVTAPASEEAVSSLTAAGPTPRFTDKARVFTRDTQDGI